MTELVATPLAKMEQKNIAIVFMSDNQNKTAYIDKICLLADPPDKYQNWWKS